MTTENNKGLISRRHTESSISLTPGHSSYTYNGDGYHNLNAVMSEKPLLDYFLVLVRFWWLIAFCSLIGLGVGILKSKSAVRLYKSTSSINIGRYVPPMEGPMAALLRDETNSRDYFYSQIVLLESNALAANVLKNNPDVYEYFVGHKNINEQQKDYNDDKSEIQRSKENVDSLEEIDNTITGDALNRYLGAVKYYQIDKTSMVKITAIAQNPEIAAKIANSHAEEFISMVRSKRLAIANINLEFLKERSKESENRVQSLSERLYKLSLQTGGQFALDGDGQKSEISNQVNNFIESLASARLRRSQEEGMYRELSSSPKNAIINPSPNIEEKLYQVSSTRNQYELIKKYNPRHRGLELLRLKMNQDKGAIKEYVQGQVREQEIKYKSALAQEQLLENELKKLKEKESEKNRSLVDMRVIEKELKAANEINAQIQRRLEDAVINSENGQKNVQIVDRALAPNAPYSLNTTATIASGILIGIMLGVSLSFAIDMKDNTIRSVNDVKRMQDNNILGLIPHFSKVVTTSVRTITKPVEDNITTELSESKSESNDIESLSSDRFSSDEMTIHDNSILQTYSAERVEDETDLQFDSDEINNSNKLEDDINTSNNNKPVANAIKTKITRRYRFVENKNNLNMNLFSKLFNKAARKDGSVEENARNTSVSKDIILVSAPLSRESEAFRSIRTSIICGGQLEVPQKIMITSGRKSDGKSTVAVNLAASFAQNNTKTLIIDADLRIPTIHKYFGISRRTEGLVDYLSGEIDYSQIIRQSKIDNLFVITAGHQTRQPAELLSSRQMVELLELLSMEYDQIIIDTPPICHVADALVVSKMVDGVALVARCMQTPKPVFQHAVSKLKQVKAPFMGSILNGVTRLSAFREAEYYYNHEEYAEADDQSTDE